MQNTRSAFRPVSAFKSLVHLVWCGVLLATNAPLMAAGAGTPRALPAGQQPQDQRLAPLKDLDGYFPFQPSASPEVWAARAERVRLQIQVALGLWPRPPKTPLNAVIHGRIDQPGYTVEKVYFESLPGFFVTGNLYRPKGRTGRVPGILFPHGHWADGRFFDAGLKTVQQEIIDGAERFEEGGRSLLQALSVQLARMGCVVFHYDMLGYADSVQISQALAHGFAKQRPEMNTLENWGLFSPQAEAHLQSVMGLQAWNSIRALDFLCELPDVDSQRLGVTGASGGGTQTFILGALDPRPTVAFPAVMVSTAMQGGCTCENASLLRVNTGNVEFAALFAPKPLGMSAADDWTKEMPTKGFPELKQHYQMMGAPDKVMLKALLHFGHNYNYVSRAAMYGWFNKHLRLGLEEPIVEPDYRRLTTREMTVWEENLPKPESGPEFERRLLRGLTDDADRQFKIACASVDAYRSLVGEAATVLIGRRLDEAGDVRFNSIRKQLNDGCEERVGLLRNTTYGEELPLVVLNPQRSNGQVVIWVDPAGKAALYQTSDPSQLDAGVRKLLEAGCIVIGADLLFQGEFLADGQPVRQTRRVRNPREAAAFTFGYNRALFAQRVHDLLSVIRFVQTQDLKVAGISLVGLSGAGPWVTAALAQAGSAVDRAVIDTDGFRFGRILDIHDVSFLPGGAKYGDLPGLLALSATTAPNSRIWLAGEGAQGPAVVRALYRLANAEEHLHCFGGDRADIRGAAIEWLCRF